MNHRERLLAALSHKQPDKVPIDLGSTNSSSIMVEGYDRLKEHFGIVTETKSASRWLRIVDLDERVLQLLDIDTRGVFIGSAFKKGDQELSPNQYRDMWGVERIKPAHSYYYDQIVSPLAGEITISDIAHYP